MLDIADLLKNGYYESDVDIPIKEENEMAKVHVAVWYAAQSCLYCLPQHSIVQLHAWRSCDTCCGVGIVCGTTSLQAGAC